jgi:hypothetical protein
MILYKLGTWPDCTTMKQSNMKCSPLRHRRPGLSEFREAVSDRQFRQLILFIFAFAHFGRRQRHMPQLGVTRPTAPMPASSITPHGTFTSTAGIASILGRPKKTQRSVLDKARSGGRFAAGTSNNIAEAGSDSRSAAPIPRSCRHRHLCSSSETHIPRMEPPAPCRTTSV